jgi:RimJ/RimL family protein N-acetyltransferase
VGRAVAVVISVDKHRAPRTLRTRRLTGRSVDENDLDYIIETDTDMRVQEWLFGAVQTETQSRDRLGRWIAMWREHGMGFWIFRDTTGRRVGHGGLFRSPRERGEIEVGYVILPADWGRGYATEIAEASLRIGFDRLGLKRIIGMTKIENAVSRRVLEKCGMLVESETPSQDGVTGVLYAIDDVRWRSRAESSARPAKSALLMAKTLKQGKSAKASEHIDKLIRDTDDWRGAVLAKIRKVVLSADKEIVEEWKWMGTPTFSKNSVICIMNPHKGKVKMTFSDGAKLEDPDKLFNAGLEGKKWRAIDFLEGDKVNERALKALVKRAAQYDALNVKGSASKAKAKPKKSK